MSLAKKRFIILLVDGARYDVFQELLDAGQLPQISDFFLSEGSYVPASGACPSTTGPAYMPFITGCFPGTCNVPGIRWFDKKVFATKRFSLKRFRSYVGLESLLMNHDMNPDCKTLFDYFPKSYNIFSSINRGVSSEGNLASHMRLWYWYYAHLTDRWHLFTVFPGVDEYSHLSYPRHPKALEAYRYIDHVIGQMAQTLRREGKYEETAIFIVSDHGLSETRKHFGVASFLESQGIKTFYYPKIFKAGFDAASMVSGNAMLHLYFKGHQGWEERLSFKDIEEKYPKLISEFLENPAVDLLLGQNEDGWIEVLGRQASFRVKEEGHSILVEKLKGEIIPLAAGVQKLSRSEALKITEATSYPDLFVQAAQIFRSPRCGDMVLSAAKGYDLRKRFEHPEHKSSHGALHDEHMLTPLFSNVKIKRNFVRSADLFPSILKLANKPLPDFVDGEAFF